MHVPPPSLETFYPASIETTPVELLEKLIEEIGETNEVNEPDHPIEESVDSNDIFLDIISKTPSELSNRDVRALRLLFEDPSQITVFRLSANKLFSCSELKTVLEKLEDLQEVDLSLSEADAGLNPPFHGACDSYVSSLADTLLTRCSHIRVLRVNQVPDLCPEALSGLLRAIPNLEQLHLHGYTNLCDTQLEALSAATGHLRLLDLQDGTKIKGDGLIKLIEANPKLEVLSLAKCHELTTSMLLKIAKASSSLLELDLRDVDQCTDEVLECFVTHNPKLDRDLGNLRY